MAVYESMAIVKSEERGIDRLIAAQDANGYLARVSVSPGEITDYETQLGASRKDDKAKCRKKHGFLAVLFRKVKPKPSRRTTLLEKILDAHEEIQTSSALFKGMPQRIEQNRNAYEKLISEEQALVRKIESYRDDYSRAQKDKADIALMLDYARLSSSERKRADDAVKYFTGIDIDLNDAETRQALCKRLLDEGKLAIDRIEMDFPFAERELASARRQMAVIEQYNEEKVRNGFVPAMDKLHALVCEYREAKTRADVTGAEADLDGISQRCGRHIDELKAMREQIEAEDEIDAAVAEDIKKLDVSPKATGDLLSRMDTVLGIADSYAEEPVVIDAEFTERKQ